MKSGGNRVRLGVDFADEDAMIKWFKDAKERGLIDNSVGVFRSDALDHQSVGVTFGNTYVAKVPTDRFQAARVV